MILCGWKIVERCWWWCSDRMVESWVKERERAWIANGLRDGIIMIIQVQNVCITIKWRDESLEKHRAPPGNRKKQQQQQRQRQWLKLQLHGNVITIRAFVHTISVSHYRYYGKRRVVKTMATNNKNKFKPTHTHSHCRRSERKRKEKEYPSSDRYNGTQS